MRETIKSVSERIELAELKKITKKINIIDEGGSLKKLKKRVEQRAILNKKN